MKKLLLLSAVLLGAVSVSQAGVHFNLGFGLPLPPLPGVVIGAPATVYGPPPVVVAPPPVYFGYGGYGCAPGYGYGYSGYPYRYGYYGHGHSHGHGGGYAYHGGHYRGGHH